MIEGRSLWAAVPSAMGLQELGWGRRAKALCRCLEGQGRLSFSGYAKAPYLGCPVVVAGLFSQQGQAIQRG
jgi:hypothetical protein